MAGSIWSRRYSRWALGAGRVRHQVHAGEVGDLEVRHAVLLDPAHDALHGVVVDRLYSSSRPTEHRADRPPASRSLTSLRSGSVSRSAPRKTNAQRHVGAAVGPLEQRRRLDDGAEQGVGPDRERLLERRDRERDRREGGDANRGRTTRCPSRLRRPGARRCRRRPSRRPSRTGTRTGPTATSAACAHTSSPLGRAHQLRQPGEVAALERLGQSVLPDAVQRDHQHARAVRDRAHGLSEHALAALDEQLAGLVQRAGDATRDARRRREMA